MSQEYCVECGDSFAQDEVFHLTVFNRSWVHWCFNCATKQLKWSDYKLVLRGNTKRDIHIKSIEEKSKVWTKIIEELLLCCEKQGLEGSFPVLTTIANDIVYGDD